MKRIARLAGGIAAALTLSGTAPGQDGFSTANFGHKASTGLPIIQDEPPLNVVWQMVTNAAPWHGRSMGSGAVYADSLWMLGGRHQETRLNDVWRCADGVNWEQTAAVAAWGPRYGARSAVYDGKLWVLGGSDSLFMNDVWFTANGTDWGQATNAAAWAPRYQPAVFAWQDRLWLIGGQASGTQVGGGIVDYADIWNTTDGANWTLVSDHAPWGGRMGMGVITTSEGIWLLGGHAAGAGYNDVWHSTNGVDWTEVTASAGWSTRWSFGALALDGNLWVMGGLRSDASRLNDVWWSEDGLAWHSAAAPADWSGRSGAIWMAFDEKIWVLGGEHVWTEGLNDVWRTPSDEMTTTTSTTTTLSTSTSTTTTTSTSSTTAPVGLNTGLILHYPFSEDLTNIVADASGNGRHGTAYGGAAWTTNGQIAAGLDLDGINDYVGRADVLGGLAQGSAGLWFRPRSWSPAPVVKGLLGSTTISANMEPGDGLTLGSHPTDLDDLQIMFGIYDYPNRQWYRATSGFIPEDGKWYHFMGTWGTNGLTCYVNGELMGTHPFTGPAPSRNHFMVGRSGWPQSYVNGVADDVRIYNRALPATEVMDLFLAGGGVVTTSTTTTSTLGTTSTTTITTTSTTTAPPLELVWQDVNSAAGWSARSVHAVEVFDDDLWVLGGRQGGTMFNDVWRSIDGVAWHQVTASAPWPGRYGMGSAVFDGHLWIMGGVDAIGYFNDVWRSANGVDWVSVTNHAPWSARTELGVFVWDGKLWVAGGSGDVRHNDIWSTINGMDWVQEAAHASWDARSGMGITVSEDAIWLMGGAASGGARNDVWRSTNGVDWVQITAAAGWSTRWGFGSAWHDDKLWVMGGLRPTAQRLNDVWYSTDGLTWQATAQPADWIGRSHMGAVAHGGWIWVLGGDHVWQQGLRDVWRTPYTPLPTTTTTTSTTTTTVPTTTTTTSTSTTTAAPDLVSDLWLHYRFEEVDGVAVEDVSGNGRMGLVFGAAWTPYGIEGRGLAFNGVSDYVRTVDIQELVRGGQYSISVWFNSPDGRRPYPQYLYGTRNSGNGDNREYMRLMGLTESDPGMVEIGPIVAGVQNNMFTWQEMDDGPTGWRHGVAVVDAAAGHTRFFLDGVESPLSPRPLTRTNLTAFVNAFPLLLGTLNSNGIPLENNYFLGSLDELRVYARALTASEVNALRADVFAVSTTSTSTTLSTTTTVATTTTSTSTTTTAPPTVVPLAQALGQPGLPWSGGGAASWFGQTAVSRDGVDAARSGSIGHGQESWMQTTITGPSSVGFWWRLSAETNDTLTFRINGIPQFTAGGVQEWRWNGYYLSSGPNVLRWTYAKNASGTAEADAAWVDGVAHGLFGEARDVGGGWRLSHWFGYVYPASLPWVYQWQHGWLYAFGTDPANLALWDSQTGWYWWTSRTYYPYIYRYDDAAWLWYHREYVGPREFFNLRTGLWEFW